MARQKMDLKRCAGSIRHLSWDKRDGDEAPALALKMDDFHYSTAGSEGNFPTWGYCTMVDLPNDQGWFTGRKGGLFGIGPYLCFGEEQPAGAALVEENLFFNLAACKTAEDVFSFAKRWGPLGWRLDAFFFDGYPCQSFLDNLEKYYVFIADREDPDHVEVERMERVIERVKNLPYLEEWRRGALPAVAAERMQDWLVTAQEIRDAIEIRRLLEAGDHEEVELHYPVGFDEERIERGLQELDLYGAIWGDGLLNYWAGFITNLERERPGFLNKKRHQAKWLYSHFLLFVVNLKIAHRVWPSYLLDGPRWRHDSLFALVWTQLANFIVEYPEHTQCRACGKWFLVQGKARGRGKKTCSDSCRVRLSQKKKAARDV